MDWEESISTPVSKSNVPLLSQAHFYLYVILFLSLFAEAVTRQDICHLLFSLREKSMNKLKRL